LAADEEIGGGKKLSDDGSGVLYQGMFRHALQKLLGTSIDWPASLPL
jgi:hypothetical protein